MFGISLLELAVIFTVALIVFGPEKLPEIARNLGSVLGELRRSSDKVKREFYQQLAPPPPPVPPEDKQPAADSAGGPASADDKGQRPEG